MLVSGIVPEVEGDTDAVDATPDFKETGKAIFLSELQFE